jgi:hypothetical protein
MFSLYVIEKHIDELKNITFDLIEELSLINDDDEYIKALDKFIELDLATIERRHTYEIATVLNIPETTNVLKFLHPINALNYKNVVNRYIRKLPITENKVNIFNMLINFFKNQKFIELESIEIQRRDRLSLEFPIWQDDEDFDDFMCKFWHENEAPEVQIKKAISQIAGKHIHQTLKFGGLIIEKVCQFDQDLDNAKMSQMMLEIKNKLYDLHREQSKELYEVDNLFKTHVVNDGTISKALEYVFELNKYCGFNVIKLLFDKYFND